MLLNCFTYVNRPCKLLQKNVYNRYIYIHHPVNAVLHIPTGVSHLLILCNAVHLWASCNMHVLIPVIYGHTHIPYGKFYTH